MTDGCRCPYCGRSLHWVANRWLGGQGSFECQQCGDFPDYRRDGEAYQPLHAAADNAMRPAVQRPRVLVVDDSQEQCDLYAFMLEPAAATVATATRGEDAVALARANHPDVVLVDLMMPGIDGWEVCKRLKADPATAAIPIVILTGIDAVDVPARARHAGAKAVLMKPCSLDRLLLTIDAALA